MKLLSVADVAKKWSMSKRRLQVLCKDGRVENASFVGNMWVIPSDAKRPVDARVKKIEEFNFGAFRNKLKLFLREMLQENVEQSLDFFSFKKIVLTALAYNIIIRLLVDMRESELEALKKELSDKILIEDMSEEKICFWIKKTEHFVEKNMIYADVFLSWSYQYLNELGACSPFAKTQFFTERYMVDFIVRLSEKYSSGITADPCCGGGNFLVAILERNCKKLRRIEAVRIVKKNMSCLYGYDIDPSIAILCAINLKIKALQIVKKYGCVTFSLWKELIPNVFYSKSNDRLGFIGWKKGDDCIFNVYTNKTYHARKIFSNIDCVVTNPPFETMKGMDPEVRRFLQKEYPFVNSDLCVAFLTSVKNMLALKGWCGVVSQNSWMFLDSFALFRQFFFNEYQLECILNLGAGAFYDLSGEKTNVSLVTMTKKKKKLPKVAYFDVSEYAVKEKESLVGNGSLPWMLFDQTDWGLDGRRLNFSNCRNLSRILEKKSIYEGYARAMQGTSTGDSKNLIHYFWEHFGDSEWKSVSKGGGYCRWVGLNSYSVKWGKDGEYIKATKGSALRNVDSFEATSLVFSDTGTSGLNVRILMPHQIFVASGPGIKVEKGNVLNHLAFLNSRISSYYIRESSPKLTIAAGYINKLPVNDAVLYSKSIELYAKICVEIKKSFWQRRANCLDYVNLKIDGRGLHDYAEYMFISEMRNELKKLENESLIDLEICKKMGVSHEGKNYLTSRIGECAFDLPLDNEMPNIDLDLYLDSLMNDCCCLNKTRTSKNTLGCDGVLEYAARDLMMNPRNLLITIEKSISSLSRVLGKYEDLLMHNSVLSFLGYDVKNGISRDWIDAKSFADYAMTIGVESKKALVWLEQKFNSKHESIFFKKGFINYSEGKLKKV